MSLPVYTYRAGLAALLSLAALPATAQTVPDSTAADERLLTAEQVRADLAVVRTALYESHAGLTWHIAPDDLARRVAAVEAGSGGPETVRAFHRRLLPLVAALHHGHTALELPTAGVGYRWRVLSRRRRYLPVEVRVSGGRVYVAADASAEGALGRGAEIVAVDGRPAAALLDTMRAYLSADGANDSFRMDALGRAGQFPHLLDLIYGPAEAFALDVVPPGGGAPVRQTVAALSPERTAELYRERMGQAVDTFPPALRFEMLGPRAARITVFSFWSGLIPAGEPGFDAFFADTFRRIREAGATDVVLDLRGNGGGASLVARDLYRYLADRPFGFAAGPATIASTTMSTVPYADGLSDGVRAFLAAPLDFARQTPDGTWVLRDDAPGDGAPGDDAPQPDAFAGRLTVLTDGGSYSATTLLVDLIYRYHRRAGRDVWFAGEPPAGDLAGGRMSAGQTLTLVLPNSRQRLTVPLIGSAMHGAGYPGETRIPDALLAPTGSDVAAGTDPVMAAVRARLGL